MLVWSVFYGNLALSQGPTTHFSELAKGLTNAGVTVIGYAPAIGTYSGPNNNFKIKYTPTINLPFIRVVVYDFLLMLRLLCTFPKPDILYVRVAYFSFFAPLVAKLFGIKLVLEINGFVVDDIASKEWTGPLAWISINCEKFLHTIADASIIVTETIYNAIHETFGISKSKLHHIKNGVNVEHFKPMDKVVCKQALGFDPATEYIGYVGCFTDWDGIEHIVRALPRIL
jgi:glycosyltransferase involved in cell wall biosynthesis